MISNNSGNKKLLSTSLIHGQDNTPSGPLTIGNFKVELNADSNRLMIEAENIGSTPSRFYSRELTPEDVKKITGEVLETPCDLFELMTFAYLNKDSDSKVSLSDEAKITISQVTIIANKARTITYVVELYEENLHPLEVCRKFLKKLPFEKGEELTNFEKQHVKILGNLINHCYELEKMLKDTNEKLNVLMNEKNGNNENNENIENIENNEDQE